MRETVVKGSDHLEFLNVHLNLSTQASSNFASTKNVPAAAGI